MILYYAVGGGLGHLTRARAVLHTLSIREPVTILTASPFAQDRRVVGDSHVVRVPVDLADDIPTYRVWLQHVIDHFRPHTIYLDAFPAGLLGEWCDLPLPRDITLIHLARLLRWPSYRQQLRGEPPRLSKTYVLEPLTPDHATFLHDQSNQVIPLTLEDPLTQDTVLRGEIGADLQSSGQPIWLIVHAGDDRETMQLVSYAQETRKLERVRARLVLLSPQRPADLPHDVRHLNLYPATLCFPLADRIITACGFNSMRQTAAYRNKHRFVPFQRRYDDQFLRACRFRDPAPSG